MARLSGISVTLYEQVQMGTDRFGAPIYEEVPVEVENVLVGEPSTDDITTATQMYGKTIQYMLGIPKCPMPRKIYIIDNLDCANCAAKIEAKFNAHPQVEEATITFATKQLRITAEDPDSLIPQIGRAHV